ncbi:sialate O-acetylesterase [Hymenobacter swuensis]|uniref:Sialate O-acetylesterase domain-containing protein n=1 Tax=Hymenobacter swuensis DY53 TaxID=1227739 RepID=W8F1Z6_9BACT|nr:sialate O-acetylesterase [Hymenobacter swuensis]AHJ98923.1 hypothetical protein Hsw_3328 [Hymenobacter swuensis DY53]
MPDYAGLLEQQAAAVIPTAPTTGAARLDGPELLALFGIVADGLRAFQSVVGGASFRLETRAPGPADGEDEDAWLNGTTGDLYKKVAGVWEPRGNIKGAASTVAGPRGLPGAASTVPGPPGKSTYQQWLEAGNVGTVATFLVAQRGADGEDGTDGADGNIIRDKTYAPGTSDNTGYQEGDQWYHTKSASSYDRYAFIGGAWRLQFSSGTATVTPVPSTLTAGLTLSTSSVTTGTAVTFTATASGGTAPYTYLTQATNTATGGVINLGSSASGSWTPQAAGTFDITTTVTDAAGAVKISPSRQVAVTAATLPTPTAPTWSFNSQTRVLSLAAPTGYESATLEYKQGSGVYQDYTAGLLTDNAAHNAGEWQGRVKASSTNQAGTPAGSPAIVASSAPAPVNLITMLGSQSNGSGAARVIELTNDPYLASLNLRRTFTNFLIWNHSAGAWQPLKIGGASVGGNNNGDTATIDDEANIGFGMEAGLANYLDRVYPGQVFHFFKYAIGGTRIQEWQTDGIHRPQLNTRWNAAMAALSGRTITRLGNSFVQGEGNFDSVSANEYAGFLTQLFTGYVSEGKMLSTTKNVITLLNLKQNTGSNYATSVRPGQEQYITANTNARYVDTADYTYYPNSYTTGLDPGEKVHMDGRGQVQHGVDFWLALQKTTNALPAAPGGTMGLATVTGGLAMNGEYITATGGGGGYTVNVGTGNKYLPANTAGWISFKYTGKASAGCMLLLNTTNAVTPWDVSKYAMQVNNIDIGSLRAYGGSDTGGTNYSIEIGWVYRFRRTPGMVVLVEESQDGEATWHPVATYPGTFSGALWPGVDAVDGKSFRVYTSGFVPTSGTTDPGTDTGRVHDFRSAVNVAEDASSWTSTVSSASLVQADVAKRATFTGGVATVNSASAYTTSAALALATLRKLTIVFNGSLTDNGSDYQRVFDQDAGALGAFTMYWEKPSNQIFIFMRTVAGADMVSTHFGFSGAFTGGVLKGRFELDLDNVGAARMHINGTNATKIPWTGAPVTFGDLPLSVFASTDFSVPMAGTLKRLAFYNKGLTDAEFAAAIAD